MKKFLVVLMAAMMGLVLLPSSALAIDDESINGTTEPDHAERRICTEAKKGKIKKDNKTGKFYCVSDEYPANQQCKVGVVVTINGRWECSVWSTNVSEVTDSEPDPEPSTTDGSTGTNWGSGPEDKCVETSILGGGKVCADSDGSAIFSILTVILNVLTVGVGILAMIGFVITGIQYLTAKDSDAQIAKAKMRMLQIVIGLFVFATMWAILNWVLPGGVFGNGGTSR